MRYTKNKITYLLSCLFVSISLLFCSPGASILVSATGAEVVLPIAGYSVGKLLIFLLSLLGIGVSVDTLGDISTEEFLDNWMKVDPASANGFYLAFNSAVDVSAQDIIMAPSVLNSLRSFAIEYFKEKLNSESLSAGQSVEIGTSVSTTDLPVIKANTPVNFSINVKDGSVLHPVYLSDKDMIAIYERSSHTMNFFPASPVKFNGAISGAHGGFGGQGCRLAGYGVGYNNVNIGEDGFSVNCSYLTCDSDLLKFAESLFSEVYAGENEISIESSVSGTLLEGLNGGLALDDTIVSGTSVVSMDDTGTLVDDGILTLPIPDWDYLVDLLEDVREGVLDFPSLVDKLGVGVVDNTSSIEEINEKIEEKEIELDYRPSNYTISGLSDFFPFCIPFDLYNILACFNASPEAPCFEWVFPSGYSSSGGVSYSTYEIDLSVFDSVARIVRIMEYAGFIVSLVIITRKLIEG